MWVNVYIIYVYIHSHTLILLYTSSLLPRQISFGVTYAECTPVWPTKYLCKTRLSTYMIALYIHVYVCMYVWIYTIHSVLLIFGSCSLSSCVVWISDQGDRTTILLIECSLSCGTRDRQKQSVRFQWSMRFQWMRIWTWKRRVFFRRLAKWYYLLHVRYSLEKKMFQHSCVTLAGYMLSDEFHPICWQFNCHFSSKLMAVQK